MKTGGHIKRANVGSVEEHNERKQEYLDRLKAAGHPLHYFPELTHTNQHWVNEDRHYHGKSCAEIFELQKRWYTKLKHQPPQLKDRPYVDKNGIEKVRAGWSPIREMVVVIKPDTKLSDFDDVKAWFLKKGITPVRLDLHFDEGHDSKKDGKRHINNHGHMVLDWIDWKTGSTIKLGKRDMSELQTVLANALGMERGELKEVTGKEYIDQANYRAMAQAQENREIAQENEQLKTQRDALTSSVADLSEQESAINEAITTKTDHKLSLESAIGVLQQEVTALEDSKRKADKKARSSIWQRVAAVFGADKLIDDLRKKLRDAEEREAALKAKIAKEREEHKAKLQEARKVNEKPLQDALRRIGAVFGLYNAVDIPMTVGQVEQKAKEVVESRDSATYRCNKAEKELKQLKQERSQEQGQSRGIHV